MLTFPDTVDTTAAEVNGGSADGGAAAAAAADGATASPGSAYYAAAGAAHPLLGASPTPTPGEGEEGRKGRKKKKATDEPLQLSDLAVRRQQHRHYTRSKQLEQLRAEESVESPL